VLYATAQVHSGWDKVKADGIIPRENKIDGGHAFAIVAYDRAGHGYKIRGETSGVAADLRGFLTTIGWSTERMYGSRGWAFPLRRKPVPGRPFLHPPFQIIRLPIHTMTCVRTSLALATMASFGPKGHLVQLLRVYGKF
jgi:hypothetical protein